MSRRLRLLPPLTALSLLVSCSNRSAPAPSTVSPIDNRAVLAVVRRALELDAAGSPADSLYVSGASVIANGTVRRRPPRFAGVTIGGRVVLSELTGEVATTSAWVHTSYRWVSGDGRLVERGRATVILDRTSVGWRIRHVHSSLALPWDARPAYADPVCLTPRYASNRRYGREDGGRTLD